ncbi:MAG TPA: hypothetical protein VMV25_06895 [Steroidobacteraceae bacterium]|nr:hypothetical protein [Steroidobacteraceae bacterium]
MTILKGIVFSLILANIGYFLWARGIAAPPPMAAPAAAPTLKLASASPPASPPPALAPRPATAADAIAPSGGAAAAPQRPAPGAAAAAAATRCISIGPFLDVAEAARAAATLRGGGYQPRQRVANGDVWAGVWVYLPMPTAAAAAVQMRAKLMAGGIDDALEMPGPNDLPVLSLGLFSEPKRAEGRVQLAQSLGFKPVISERKRTGDVYWVDIGLKPTDAALNPAQLEGGSDRIVRLKVIGCPLP